jgi:hypothetical protein
MDPRRITFVPERFIMNRYLTKICDQLVCLLSSTHSQAIVWDDEDEDPDDNSLDSEDTDSCRLFNFRVEKKSEQDEDVTARQGFTVRYLRLIVSVRIDLNHHCSWQDELLTYCQPTLDTQSAHR